MSVKINVNTGQLESLKQKLKHKRAVFAAIGAFADNQLQMTQSGGQDPYGNRWAALKSGRPSFLRETGTLEATRLWESGDNWARVTFGASYAPFHQSGTSRMPQRQLIPQDGLPGAWASPINRIVDRWANTL